MEEKIQSIETNSKKPEMLELSDKDIKASTIKMPHKATANMFEANDRKQSLAKKYKI